LQAVSWKATFGLGGGRGVFFWGQQDHHDIISARNFSGSDTRIWLTLVFFLSGQIKMYWHVFYLEIKSQKMPHSL
jgi:hypothetical protein